MQDVAPCYVARFAGRRSFAEYLAELTERGPARAEETEFRQSHAGFPLNVLAALRV